MFLYDRAGRPTKQVRRLPREFLELQNEKTNKLQKIKFYSQNPNRDLENLKIFEVDLFIYLDNHGHFHFLNRESST